MLKISLKSVNVTNNYESQFFHNFHCKKKSKNFYIFQYLLLVSHQSMKLIHKSSECVF